MKGFSSISLAVLALLALIKQGTGLYCHQCFSSMGGCGENLNLIMFPWRDCGTSEYCVKIVEKFGSDIKITRACESELMVNTYHRLRMPVRRRQGFCLNARVNNPYNGQETTDPTTQYCFCNDFNGCNTGSFLKTKFLPVTIFSIIVTFFLNNVFLSNAT